MVVLISFYLYSSGRNVKFRKVLGRESAPVILLILSPRSWTRCWVAASSSGSAMLSAGGTSREMNFAPIDGLRMLAVETGLLVAFTLLMFVVFRFLRPSLSRPRWLEPILHSELRSVLFVIAAALVGRALLLPWVGIPQPHINDEFSYLLMGDTFSHFRLANPTPAAWQHFETFHVNLVPTYHSKYPVAQGLALAFGEILFRQPWVGMMWSQLCCAEQFAGCYKPSYPRNGHLLEVYWP